ncbi:MAG: HAD-IC family P-type ATPase, partial [Syntrophothermus sp.]
REGLDKVISSLSKYKLYLLSGDNEGEKKNLLKYFGQETHLLFKQSPEDKLNFIKDLQAKGHQVLMIGDGLNDAGALMKSNVGISVSEDTSNFSPACDAILDAGVFSRLGDFLKFSELNLKIIKASFLISLIYNFAGLSFAVRGVLSPVIAAILMPLSSVTVVLFTTLMTNLFAKKEGLL